MWVKAQLSDNLDLMFTIFKSINKHKCKATFNINIVNFLIIHVEIDFSQNHKL